jgi:excisionase family DNA binding protein
LTTEITGQVSQLVRLTLSCVPDELLTTGEAAELLGVSRWTCLRYIREGRLPAVRLPSGHMRIKRSDVERLIEQGREDVEQDR